MVPTPAQIIFMALKLYCIQAIKTILYTGHYNAKYTLYNTKSEPKHKDLSCHDLSAWVCSLCCTTWVGVLTVAEVLVDMYGEG